MRKDVKKILSVLLSAILMLLCSCADLGVGEAQDSFKKYFSSVILTSREAETERSISAFNQNINYENCTDIETVVDHSEYLYFAFEVARGYTLTVDEFAFFAKTDGEAGILDLEFYVTDKLPQKNENEGSGSTEGSEAESGDAEITEDEVFTEDKKYHTDSMSVSAEWSSVLLEFDSPQTVNGGEYIVVRIKNNSDDAPEDDKISFTINYLMFHFVEVVQ